GSQSLAIKHDLDLHAFGAERFLNVAYVAQQLGPRFRRHVHLKHDAMFRCALLRMHRDGAREKSECGKQDKNSSFHIYPGFLEIVIPDKLYPDKKDTSG